MDRFAALEAFVGVAEEGSFTAAAERMDVSKSVISKQVKALEQHLGVRLFNRTTRRLHLTEPGAQFRDRALRILEELGEAERAVGDLQARPRGLLRVNVPVSFALQHLSAVLPAFLARYPELSVDVVLNDRFVDLVNEGFDVAIRITELQDSSHIARRIAPCEGWICASPDYLARHGRPQTPEALAEHACLVYAYARNTREWRLTGADGRTHRVPVRGRFQANNGEILIDAACAGTGLVLTPDFIANRAVAEGRLERVLCDYRAPGMAIHAIYPYTHNVSAKVRVFIDFLRECYGDGPPPWAWERLNGASDRADS
ncbi:LysR family transcriptional regulator [Arhodomonas aquaeolei]|uniref:LysR family transcriptional regulator n=1 Tax=Arhodomonas aquaeolei TaxID=2369 RepID=UPI00037C2D8F|nr:LysR family transcriptional regulator [Arhodomonas aquaeolei]